MHRPDPGDLPPVLTAEEAAKYLRVKPRTLRTLAARGELRPVSIGGRNRWTAGALADYLDRLHAEAVAS